MSDDGFEPTGWWKVLDQEGKLWCETSNKHEALSSMRPGDTIHRLHEKIEQEWRRVGLKDL